MRCRFDEDLAGRVGQVTDRALRSGALQPILARSEEVEEHGVRFVIQVTSEPQRKRDATHRQDGDGDSPFLPPDPELFVARVGPSHNCLLNKFRYLPCHLLIATRELRPQQEPLCAEDLAALACCLGEIGGMGFYNAGGRAGASQGHKHLQLVRNPLGEAREGTAFDGHLEPLLGTGTIGSCPDLPFRNAVIGQDQPSLAELDGSDLQRLYRELARWLRLEPGADAYNLLLARRFMMLVPRRKEHFEGVSINALGFAGSLAVPDEQALERVRRRGPFAVLREVAG